MIKRVKHITAVHIELPFLLKVAGNSRFIIEGNVSFTQRKFLLPLTVLCINKARNLKTTNATALKKQMRTASPSILLC